MSGFELVRARVMHARHGGAVDAFTYGVDFVLAPMNATASPAPVLFARNGLAAAAVLDRDHGEREADAAAWARRLAWAEGLGEALEGEMYLLTQPRTFGFVFNPVSFWFFTDKAGALRAVLAEVNNTEGERCAYLVRRTDRGPIQPTDVLTADKAMYVSPYQEERGLYSFSFAWRAEAVGVRIVFMDEAGAGMIATLDGPRAPMTFSSTAASLARFPLGSARVLALIFWQALVLKLKGERYRPFRRQSEIGEGVR